MDILSRLMLKYSFYNHKISKVLHNDLFIAVATLPNDTLVVCDGAVTAIVKDIIGELENVLVLERPRAFATKENISKVLYHIALKNVKQVLAFGSGAVNDVCKVACNITQVVYAFVPTALSMNGIVSNNASVSDGEIKKSFLHKSASIIYLQDSILQATPRRFTGAGIMDSLAGYTAQNDFLFAHLLEPKKYPIETITFEHFDAQMQVVIDLLQMESEAYTRVSFIIEQFELLYISGMIMNYYDSSIAFSGGEHHIAHTIEARNPHVAKNFLHGEVISAVLPYYSNLQLDFNESGYIAKSIVQRNNAVDFVKIAKMFNMPYRPEHLGISSKEFETCVKLAKNAKERPTLLSLLF